MNDGAIKSPVQIAALAVLFGGFMLAIALTIINPEFLDSPIGTTLLLVSLAALFLHTLGMLINAFQNKRTGWVVSIFLFGPFASIIYFVTKYDIRDRTISSVD